MPPRRPTRLPRTATWAVAGFLAIALAVGIVLLVPPALYPSLKTPDADLVGLKAQERFDIETARLELQAGLRQTLIQSLAVLVTVSGALLAWRQSLHERQQKRDDFNLKLFGEARSDLSHESEAVRIGGIYSLEALAARSTDHRRPVAEVLAAFVRERSPWPPTGSRLREDAEIMGGSAQNLLAAGVDVHIALETLVKNARDWDPTHGLFLSHLDLRVANLPDAYLEGADLTDTRLTGAYLPRAQLRGADLRGTVFLHADLTGADLTDANVSDATDFSEAACSGVKWPGGTRPPDLPRVS